MPLHSQLLGLWPMCMYIAGVAQLATQSLRRYIFDRNMNVCAVYIPYTTLVNITHHQYIFISISIETF